jgi:hypothetical protein
MRWSQPGQTQPAEVVMEVRGFLEGLRGRLRRVLLLEGLSQLTVAVLVGCALAILLDYCWPIPAPARLALLLALIALVTTVAYRRLLRPLARRMDDRTMAQLAERRIPALDGRLLTRVDGIDLGSHDGQLLASALTPQAVTTLIPAARLPGRISLALVLAGAAALIALSFPRLMHDGFNRLLLPFGAGEWERKAALAGELDRVVVAADDPLVVRIERTKGPEAPLRLSWSLDGVDQTERRMLSGLVGPWHQALTLPPGSYRLVAESGDAVPLVLHGRLVKRPLLTHVQATLYPPHYISLPKQELATLACTALPGSRLEFSLDFALDSGREVAEAGITLGGTPLAVTRSARGLTGTFKIKEGGMLEVHLADQDGIGPNPPPRFPVTLTEDRKPVVALDGPRNREAVTVRAQLHLAIDASDDYGLATLQLLTAVLAGEPPADAAPAPAPAAGTPPPVHQETLAFDVAGLTATTRKTVIDLSKLVKEGDRLQFTGRAEDANDISGPGIGLSQPLELKVVSESELRQELDRMLGEAKDRLAQAREELGGGLAKPERLMPASRGAALVAVKAGELLTQVVRRWSENQLQEDQLKPAREAEVLVNTKALLQLAEAVKGTEAAARSADQLLAEAEKLLASMLQAGDLTRLLAALIEREKGLAVESRAFVMEYLTKPLDDAAKVRQSNLTQRQKELADLVKEIERRILALASQQLEKAQDLVRSQGPADQLLRAATALGSDSERAAATKHQETAIATMLALLDLLRGSDAAGDLAKQAGQLAARQEQLNKQLEEGAVPKSQEAEQKKLHEDTEQFRRQLDKQPQAEKAVAAASQSQGEAEKAMAGDDSAGAQREGAAAASLLREAQRQLGGDQEKKKEEGKKKPADVLALLRELHHLPAALVADSLPVFTRLGDKPLDFAAQRDVPAFAEREGDILLRLREEGLKPVEKMPIVVAAMNRVALALEKSQAHLAQPALGTHGLRLEKIALAELARLIEIAENIPPPEKKDGDGKGGGNGNQAPFPPGAELALLAAMQEELSALTAAGRPVDLAGMQAEASKLVELLAANSRPGSRPSLLLSRALRAMKSAGDNLGNGDRGLATRHEQAAAEAALRRLMAEAKGGGGSDPKPQPDQKRKPGESPAKPPPPSESTASATPGGNKAPQPAKTSDGKGEVGVVTGGAVKEQLLTLPQELREKLLEAHKQPLPPGALRIFERYLELLEEGK